jgi:hypothetical protein
MDPQIQIQTEDIANKTPDSIRESDLIINNDNLRTTEDVKLGNETIPHQTDSYQGLNENNMEAVNVENEKDKQVQGQQSQSEHEDIKVENSSSQASSDEEFELTNKANILSMFTQMTKESIAKI